MYTKNEVVKNWKDEAIKELYDEFLGKLCEWNENVDRLDELITILDSLVGNKEFEKFFSHDEFGIEKCYEYDMKLKPIVHGAYDAFNIIDYFPYYFTLITRHLVVASSIASIMSIIELAFVHYNNRLLTLYDDKIIQLSNIFYYLTFFVEDYDNPQNRYVEYGYDYYKMFFKRAKKTYWADKKAKKLYTTITDLTATLTRGSHFKFDTHNLTTMVAIYLMVCNALKNDRNSVSSENVVIGYLTAFKIIFNDIRPLVYQLYDEDKWG